MESCFRRDLVEKYNRKRPYKTTHPPRQIRMGIMSTGYINTAIKSLGRDLASLIRVGTIPVATQKIKAFPEDENFHMNVMKGVELQFYENNQRLESVTITLKNRAPWSMVYVGGLPEPYKLSMNSEWIRKTHGTPYKSQGPKPMPKPMYYSGDWDNYRPLDKENIEIYISYSENMEVSALSFRLIDKGHDRFFSCKRFPN